MAQFLIVFLLFYSCTNFFLGVNGDPPFYGSPPYMNPHGRQSQMPPAFGPQPHMYPTSGLPHGYSGPSSLFGSSSSSGSSLFSGSGRSRSSSTSDYSVSDYDSDYRRNFNGNPNPYPPPYPSRPIGDPMAYQYPSPYLNRPIGDPMAYQYPPPYLNRPIAGPMAHAIFPNQYGSPQGSPPPQLRRRNSLPPGQMHQTHESAIPIITVPMGIQQTRPEAYGLTQECYRDPNSPYLHSYGQQYPQPYSPSYGQQYSHSYVQQFPPLSMDQSMRMLYEVEGTLARIFEDFGNTYLSGNYDLKYTITEYRRYRDGVKPELRKLGHVWNSNYGNQMIRSQVQKLCDIAVTNLMAMASCKESTINLKHAQIAAGISVLGFAAGSLLVGGAAAMVGLAKLAS